MEAKHFIIGFILSATIVACGRPTETIEVRLEAGGIERYERRKSDSAKEGKYERFNSEGRLVEQATYQNDSLDGQRTLFYPNGQKEIVENYKRGIFDGPYFSYYENGQIQLEQQYVNGSLQGESRAYYPSGNIKEKVTIRDNEENGPFIEYYENGKVKAEGAYKNGDFETGELKEYDSTGVLIRIANCQKGKCQTVWKKEGTPE